MTDLAPAAGHLEPASFDALEGYAQDDARAAFEAFRRTAEAIAEAAAPLRAARPPSPALIRVAREALSLGDVDEHDARKFFASHFRPHRVRAGHDAERGFLTGYYEPMVRGSLTRTPDFAEPILARPDDLDKLRRRRGACGVRSRAGGRAAARGRGPRALPRPRRDRERARRSRILRPDRLARRRGRGLPDSSAGVGASGPARRTPGAPGL